MGVIRLVATNYALNSDKMQCKCDTQNEELFFDIAIVFH